MELEYLGVILEAKKEDYNKQVNLKKFYKETLTEEEYKNFEKMLKTKKSEITELESIVKKMNAYSDQYSYERIMAMSETEFDAIKEREIEERKSEIRKHNRDINDKNIAMNAEISNLNDEITLLKRELEQITAEIGETGKYTKETVKRAKTIKEKIQDDNEKIKKNRETIEENDKSIITNDDISIDFETYKKEKLSELGKKYVTEIPEVSALDEFFCAVQKKGKTPLDIETAMNEFKNGYTGGYSKEGYEYFDPIYRNDFGCLDEDDINASNVTELLEKYFEVVEKGTKGDSDKGRIERNRLVGYNTNKKHNISEITKEKLLKELIEGAPFYKTIKDNSVVNGGCFLSLNDRIKVQRDRLERVSEWTDNNPDLALYAKITDLIEEFFEITKNREIEEKNIDQIYDIYKKLRRYLEKECFKDNKYAVDYMSLYDEFSASCDTLKALAAEKNKLSSKKIVLNKKEHSKTIDTIDLDIMKEQEIIKGLRKKIKDNLDKLSDYLYEVFDEPENIMYPKEVEEPIEVVFNVIRKRDKDIDFSLSDEQKYLSELEKDLKYAIAFLDKYDEVKDKNRTNSIVQLCANLEVQSISPSIIECLDEERSKKALKASEIASRINEARVNLYLREQKEKALSDASKAKSEILGAVINHLDLEETKTDIFAAI